MLFQLVSMLKISDDNFHRIFEGNATDLIKDEKFIIGNYNFRKLHKLID